MQIVNWKLISHPINWLTVVLMLLLAAMAGTLVLQGLGITPSTADQES